MFSLSCYISLLPIRLPLSDCSSLASCRYGALAVPRGVSGDDAALHWFASHEIQRGTIVVVSVCGLHQEWDFWYHVYKKTLQSQEISRKLSCYTHCRIHTCTCMSMCCCTRFSESGDWVKFSAELTEFWLVRNLCRWTTTETECFSLKSFVGSLLRYVKVLCLEFGGFVRGYGGLCAPWHDLPPQVDPTLSSEDAAEMYYQCVGDDDVIDSHERGLLFNLQH